MLTNQIALFHLLVYVSLALVSFKGIFIDLCLLINTKYHLKITSCSTKPHPLCEESTDDELV